MKSNLSNIASGNELVGSLVLELVKINIDYHYEDLEIKIKNSNPDILNKIKSVNAKLHEMVQSHIIKNIDKGPINHVL